MSILHHTNITQLRHRIDEVVEEQLPDTPSGGGSSSDGTSGDNTQDTPTPPVIDENHVVVPIEQLEDNEEAFFPKTHVAAVITEDNRRLSAALTEINGRISALESQSTVGGKVTVADNFLTAAKGVALSASRGKYLFDSVKNSTTLEFTGTADGVTFSSADAIEVSEGAIDEHHIADGAIHADHLSEEAVETEALKDGCVTADKLADGTVGKAKLDSVLTTDIERIEDFVEWQDGVDIAMADHEERIANLEETMTLMASQNQYLLTLHQKMKHSTITTSILDTQTGTWVDMPVADYSPQYTIDSVTPPAQAVADISLESVRMTGMQMRLTWKFYDEMDSKDYVPESYSLKADILATDGTTRSVALSTDRGQGALQQLFTLLDLHLGDKVTITSKCHYCWLDFPSTLTLNIIS